MAAAARSDTEAMDRQVAVRLERQKRLTAPDAPSLWVILGEGVLHRQVGGTAVMRDQLAHFAADTPARSWASSEPMPFVVVYDANALYGNAQRDLLIRIAQSGLVQAKWTDQSGTAS